MITIKLYFLLEKRGAILKSSKGFTLIEVLIASSIIVMMVTTFVPIASLLSHEREVLSDRRMIISLLHDELQPFIWEEHNAAPSTFTKTIHSIRARFHFSREKEFIKGCAEWENVKKNKEKQCLYSLPEK